MTELTVTIKGVESSYKQKFLLYDEFTFNEDDPVIKKCVEEALANAKIEPEDIKVRALLQMR
jgi:3-oxoacyl-[acyl-carrier-protein] synthase III